MKMKKRFSSVVSEGDSEKIRPTEGKGLVTPVRGPISRETHSGKQVHRFSFQNNCIEIHPEDCPLGARSPCRRSTGDPQ